MIIDIKIVPEGHSEISRETDCGDYKNDLPLLVGTISCVAAIDRNGGELFIHLAIKGVTELECSRCLNPVRVPFESETRLVVKEQLKSSEGSDDEEEVDFFYTDRNQFVDLCPAIYDEIMISVPVQPLCSEDCPGIIINPDAKLVAPESGAIDPRWAALIKLKNNR